MTQPAEAVGGSNDTVVAAELTPEDRLLAALDVQSEEEQPEQEEEAPEAREGEEAELTEEDVAEVEADLPPIEPPVSLSAEEKETFKNLPREAQEFTARRIGELEKGFQAKAQEAAQARSHAEREALSHVEQLNTAYAEQLTQYASHFEVQQPDPSLIVSDPELYAHQMRQYQYFTAQRQQAQQQAETARQEAAKAQHALEAKEAEEFRAVLSEQFPEFLEPSNAKLREDLALIAKDLGYPAELLSQANANDILALKRASDWKAKAAKYDTLMAKKMEKVREAKNMPKVSKPGVAVGKGAVEQSRYAADREAMKKGDRGAIERVISQFI